MATTNASGALISTHIYGPFGEPIQGQTNPNNTAPGSTYAWAGRQKVTETGFTLATTQMGARLYLPALARFAQVDPIEGGVHNAYVYVADPVNGSDYSGQMALGTLIGLMRAGVAVGSNKAVGAIAAGVRNTSSKTKKPPVYGTAPRAGAAASRQMMSALSKLPQGSTMTSYGAPAQAGGVVTYMPRSREWDWMGLGVRLLIMAE